MIIRFIDSDWKKTISSSMLDTVCNVEFWPCIMVYPTKMCKIFDNRFHQNSELSTTYQAGIRFRSALSDQARMSEVKYACT